MRLLNLALCMTISLLLPVSGCSEAEPGAPGTEDPAPPASLSYDQPVPESDAVDDDWFSNTAMIGHSLMQGMQGYSGLNTPDYYTLNGAMASQLLTSNEIKLPSGATGTLSGGLSGKTYENVYLFVGINEISGDLTVLKNDYLRLIELVRSNSPDASIYVLAVLPVTERKASGGVFTLNRITAYNDMLLELCGEEECWYIDLYDCFADENGYLPSSASFDGIHLEAEQYIVLADYLKTHTAG